MLWNVIKSLAISCLFLVFSQGVVFGMSLYLVETNLAYQFGGAPGGIATPPVNLYEVHEAEKKASKVREVVAGPPGITTVAIDYDRRMIAFGINEAYLKDHDNKYHYSFIDMDSPEDEKSAILPHVEHAADLKSYFCDVPDLGQYFAVLSSHMPDFSIIGINVDDFKQKILSKDVFKYARYSGPVGGPEYKDYQILYPEGGNKTKIWIGGYNFDPGWTLPEPFSFKKMEVVPVFVNNDFIRVFSYGSGKVHSVKDNGYTPFYIFNKSTKVWDKVDIQGGTTVVRGFGAWLGGYVTDSREGRESPGYEKVTEEYKYTPRDAYYHFNKADIYSPGILFIYNALTKKMFYFNTGVGDSEVLLVEDGFVYYRVYDEIYKAEITGSGVGEGTILAKSDYIIDVHWAFIGPSS